MISDEVGLTIMNKCDFDDYTFASPHNVTDSCNLAIAEANKIAGDYMDSYDVILDVCYPSLIAQELRLRKLLSVGVDVCMSYERQFYFNLPEVQKALRANQTSLPYSWSMCCGIVNYRNTDVNVNILPLLKRIIEDRIPVWVFRGDQDSVVPLLGSQTLVCELAHDLNFKITVPYGALVPQRPGGRLGNRVREFIDLCHCKRCCSYGTLCTVIKSFASIQFICAQPEIAKYDTSFDR